MKLETDREYWRGKELEGDVSDIFEWTIPKFACVFIYL